MNQHDFVSLPPLYGGHDPEAGACSTAAARQRGRGFSVRPDCSPATKDNGVFVERIRRVPPVETGAQCFGFSNGLAEIHFLELLDPVVERLLVDMTYSSLPGLSSSEDHEWSEAGHEMNELIS